MDFVSPFCRDPGRPAHPQPVAAHELLAALVISSPSPPVCLRLVWAVSGAVPGMYVAAPPRPDDPGPDRTGQAAETQGAQVWLFATGFDVPATNNGSENAIRGYKLAAKISGCCWRTLATLQRHCRIRSTPPPAATAATPSPPSATPSTAAPGCHRNQHDQLTRHP